MRVIDIAVSRGNPPRFEASAQPYALHRWAKGGHPASNRRSKSYSTYTYSISTPHSPVRFRHCSRVSIRRARLTSWIWDQQHFWSNTNPIGVDRRPVAYNHHHFVCELIIIPVRRCIRDAFIYLIYVNWGWFDCSLSRHELHLRMNSATTHITGFTKCIVDDFDALFSNLLCCLYDVCAAHWLSYNIEKSSIHTHMCISNWSCSASLNVYTFAFGNQLGRAMHYTGQIINIYSKAKPRDYINSTNLDQCAFGIASLFLEVARIIKT